MNGHIQDFAHKLNLKEKKKKKKNETKPKWTQQQLHSIVQNDPGDN